mmetsp:Transcript_45366/g.124966  ORF Transcript_45366/g.124966 Transcript_45366/m.124966 type:complete len:232 (+) Transcript_45366:409-1104(+)
MGHVHNEYRAVGRQPRGSVRDPFTHPADSIYSTAPFRGVPVLGDRMADPRLDRRRRHGRGGRVRQLVSPRVSGPARSVRDPRVRPSALSGPLLFLDVLGGDDDTGWVDGQARHSPTIPLQQRPNRARPPRGRVAHRVHVEADGEPRCGPRVQEGALRRDRPVAALSARAQIFAQAHPRLLRVPLGVRPQRAGRQALRRLAAQPAHPARPLPQAPPHRERAALPDLLERGHC